MKFRNYVALAAVFITMMASLLPVHTSTASPHSALPVENIGFRE